MITDAEDCCVERGGQRFRYRVGAIIIEDGCVLLATNEGCKYYYSVGGGVHIGETSEQAVLREVKEETGVDYQIDRLLFIHENFFAGDTSKAMVGKVCHELSLYYLMKPRGAKQIRCESSTADGKESTVWAPINKLGELTVFPDFYKTELARLPDGVKRIVTELK